MSKHTPGPWEVTFGKAEGCGEFAVHNDVTICTGDNEATAWEANARLIAAAPELLAACKELLGWAKEVDGENRWPEVAAAIAKAEGGAK